MQSPGAPPRAGAEPPARGAFAALRHRNFQLFYSGQMLSLVGTWMQSTAQGWLVLELTDSALLLGMVTAAGSVPVLLFTLYAGVLADRVDKRRIIVAAQAGAARLGSLQAGALARWIGAPAALGAGAATLALVVRAVAWRVPELRELR